METPQQQKTRLKGMAIKNAISSWTDKKNGVYRWYENKIHTTEYCQNQIDYFKNFKF